jgi:hypothetical protein
MALVALSAQLADRDRMPQSRRRLRGSGRGHLDVSRKDVWRLSNVCLRPTSAAGSLFAQRELRCAVGDCYLNFHSLCTNAFVQCTVRQGAQLGLLPNCREICDIDVDSPGE